MKILFLTDNFPPEVNAPATRTFEHCREWVKMGADVSVITCAPNFPHGKVYSGYKNRLFKKEIIEGIKVVRVWSYITANEGFIKRVIDYISFSLSSFIAGLFISADVIVATSPQFFTTWSACLLSWIKKRPWVFELRDLWPESIKTVGAINNGFLMNILESIELFLYRNADAVIPVTEAFKRNQIERGINADKIQVISNGANLELYKPASKNRELLKHLGLDGRFIISYIGTHGLAHGLEFIIRAVTEMYDTDLHFLFIGDGARKDAVVRLASQNNLKNVTFIDTVPKHEVPEYLSISDVALVPLLKSVTFKMVIPSKIFEAAAMSKPILLGVEGQAKEIVEGYKAGLCFEPENKDDFINKAYLIKNNAMLYQELQAGCKSLAAAFDRKNLAQNMYRHLENVIKAYS